jgi:AhpD family alkylhydroperoxidase
MRMALDDRIKELIAVGASVAANCMPCLRYHSRVALESGADAEEIAAAVGVGQMVRKGAASKVDKFAASLHPAATPCPEAETDECGAGE